MKNFKFKWLLLSIILSITCVTSVNAWDCGWYDVNSGSVTFYLNDTWKTPDVFNRNSGDAADFDLGTYTTSLKITSAWAHTWGRSNVYSVWLYYRVKERDAASSVSYSDYQINYEKDIDDKGQNWYTSSDVYPTIDGLSPGNYEIEYYMKLYPKSGHYAEFEDLNNGGNNFHANFTIPSRNLTIAGAANGNTVSGSQTGVSKGTEYTITATAVPGYRFNGWSKTSGDASITIDNASSSSTTITFNDLVSDVTITANFVRTYAYVEGRFKIKNEARDSETTTYGSGNWNNDATSIQMTYENAMKRFALHTYMKPAELSENMGVDYQGTPYFYIKLSTSSSALSNAWAYRPNNSGDSYQKLTTAGNKQKVGPVNEERSFWFASSDESGYAVLYFDESDIWYELEQTLNYAAGSGSGDAPATTYHMKGSSVTAAAANTFTAPEGYEFDYWLGSDDVHYAAGASVTMNSNITLTAQWRLKTYAISYAVGTAGGSGSLEGGTKTHGVTYVLSSSSSAFSRDSYIYDGWSTNENGSTKNYDFGGDYTTNAAQIFYPHWVRAYTVTHTLEYASTSEGATGEKAAISGQNYVATFAENTTGYRLPDAITVMRGSDDITTNCTWNQASGTLTIPAAQVTGDITITVTGTAKTYDGNLINESAEVIGTYTATYGSKVITINEPEPSRSGFEIGGYYLNYNAEANPPYYNQIATKSRNLLSSIFSYTDGSGNWIYTDDAPAIYVSWDPKSYIITLTASLPGDGEGTAGTGAITATMGSSEFSPAFADRVMPSKNGYNFQGYFTDEDEGDDVQVLNADATPHSNTKYITGDSKWNWPDNIEVFGQWEPKTYTVTLDPENGSSTSSITATFDATTNLSQVSKPSKSSYTFGGYYTGQGGAGEQLIDADGNWIASVSGYTGDNGSGAATWKYYTNSTITLYAKWTQDITLNQNGANKDGAAKIEGVVYNGTLTPGDLTEPKKIGYAFAGWATAADGDVVIATDGTVNEVSGWTSGGNWVHAGASTLYAKWTADVYTFTGGGEEGHKFEWNNPANWEGGVVPTNPYAEIHLEYGVHIEAGEEYHVGKVVIKPGYMLTLFCGGVLEVAGTITREGGVATEPEDISFASAGSSQSALIFNNPSGDAQTKASVSLYATGHYDPSTIGYTFQYVAVPLTSVDVATSFSGQYVYTYVWNEGTGWERRGYYSSIMGFEALGVTTRDGVGFSTRGTLVSTENLTHSLTYTADATYGETSIAGMNMFGNSWTAPIKIAACNITGYAESAIYLYDCSTSSWTGFPTESAGNNVIPAMQAYCVLATSGGGTLTINYDEAVRKNTANRTAPLRAPKRSASENNDHITLYVSDGQRETNLRLYEDEQFTDEFDNGWEARYIEGGGISGELYVQTFDKMTVLATSDLEGSVVGFVPGISSNYTISFEGDGMGYYLNDMLTQQSTLIAEGNTYMFNPDSATNATRFVISRTPMIGNTATGVDQVNDGANARKQLINGILYIIREGKIYEATGALVK